MSAALTGVVYSTEREQGERVNQSEPILTLLDCNDLWVETVVSANQASGIDTQKPVSVQIAGYSEPIAGEVDLIQPVSSIQAIAERSKLMQVQALMPAIPPTLVGQALARVTVRIPPPPQHMQSQQFCGLGQAASVTFNKKPLTQMKPFKFSTVVRLTPVEEDKGSTATVEIGGLQLLKVSPRKAAPTRERYAAVKRLVLPSFIES